MQIKHFSESVLNFSIILFYIVYMEEVGGGGGACDDDGRGEAATKVQNRWRGEGDGRVGEKNER